MELRIRDERDGDVCVVHPEGEVDIYTAGSLKERLVQRIEGGCTHVIVDMEAVSFIDSSGLGVLVGALRRVRERGGDVHIVCSHDNILKVLRITGLDKVFPLFSDERAAREF